VKRKEVIEIKERNNLKVKHGNKGKGRRSLLYYTAHSKLTKKTVKRAFEKK
jgi:hypothetical protein